MVRVNLQVGQKNVGLVFDGEAEFGGDDVSWEDREQCICLRVCSTRGRGGGSYIHVHAHDFATGPASIAE